MTRFILWTIAVLTLFVLTSCSEESPPSQEEKAAAETTVAEEQPPAQPQGPPPLPVEVITVAMKQTPVWLEYTGRTEATERVNVIARVSGRLEQILFTEGDYVEAGTPLFIIEQTAYQAAVDQAMAQRQRNEATLALARADVARYKPLVAEDLAPRQTLEQYEARVAELEASITADEAAIRDAELQLSYTEVEAPTSGRVSRSFFDVGNIVGGAEQAVLTNIVNDDPMFAFFNPTESQFQIMSKFKSQDKMPAVVVIPNRAAEQLSREPLSGFVDFTDNRVEPTTGTITMRAQVENPNNLIMEGTFVYVNVMVTDQESFIMIPPGIVQRDQLGRFVYIVDENHQAKRVDITSNYESRHYLIVNNGLAGGEQVIASGFVRLQPGAPVQPQDVTDTRGVMAVMAEQGLLPDKE
jgi:RND family efflux transporter MFP subunit